MLLLLTLIILGPVAVIGLLILCALGSIMESWDRWLLKHFKKHFKKQPNKITKIEDIDNSFVVRIANFFFPV